MIDFNISGTYERGAIITSDLASVVQQIDILFGTSQEDVLGDLDFGTNYDKYLYNLTVSNSELEHKVMNDLFKLDLHGYTPSVTVQFIEGTVRDIALIEIVLTGGDEEYNKTYVIQ